MTNPNTVNVYTHSDCLKHEMRANHPESPKRLAACLKALKSDSISKQLQWIDAPLATKKQLMRVHDKAYVNKYFTIKPPQKSYIKKDNDTLRCPDTLNAALRGAGAQIAAVDDVMKGKTKRAFCLVRPPGHHASSNKASGFCFFNNVAVGAAHALEAHKLKRVAVIDFDVHHGDGTEAIFQNDPRVMFWSSFEHPHYPNNVKLGGKPSHIKLAPMKAGSGSAEFRKIVDTQLIPSLLKFKPECIFISAGFDAHIKDHLAHINLTEEDFAYVTKRICDVAEKVAKGRVISTLEGGYNVQALAASVKSHVKALANKIDFSLKPIEAPSNFKKFIPSLFLSGIFISALAVIAWPASLLAQLMFPLVVISGMRYVFKTDQYENYCLKTKKDIAKLNTTQLKAFDIGREAENSYQAYLGSFVAWPVYRCPKAYYAGLAARQDENDGLISRIRKRTKAVC